MAGTVARDLTVSHEERLNFIRPRHHGILVTTRRNGRPQISPVTMGVDSEGRVAISSYPERAKSKNAARNEQASVCVLSNEFNGEWVQLDGRIEVIPQPEAIEALIEYYRSISGEHPDWDEYRQAMARQQKVLLRLTIDRWSPISRGGFPARLVPEA
jgi:PPOX class probable F420-dependent enzyme